MTAPAGTEAGIVLTSAGGGVSCRVELDGVPVKDSTHAARPPALAVPGTTPGLIAVPEDQSLFSGDSDRRVKAIQNATFPGLAAELYAAARDRMLAASRLTGAVTEAVRRLSADPRSPVARLVPAYRKIAAFYRFAHHSGPQLPLPLEGENVDARLRTAWEEFFRREAGELVRDNPTARSLICAAVFAGSGAGRAHETRLLDLLDLRYGRLTLGRRIRLLGDDPGDEAEAWRFAEDPDWPRLLRIPGARTQDPPPGY